MNRKTWSWALAILFVTGLTNCGSSKHTPPSVNNTPPVEVVTATSGTPQSHAIDAAFGAALVATVTANGAPASGVVVTFAAPANGPSATFSDTNSQTATGTTDSTGVATSPAVTANGTAGSYAVTASVAGVITPATFNLTNTIGAPAKITATGGTPQGAPTNTAFAAPLVATVVDSGQNPVGGALVTFSAPATGASGVFSDTGSGTTTAVTNASGVATSAIFTANGISGADTVTATAPGVSTPADFLLTNMAGAPASITATGGTPQTAAINTTFGAPLVATVFDAASNLVSGVAVTFAAPSSSSAATGTFTNGTATETDTTDANGMATSTTFSANGVAGGPYTVTATVTGVATPADFSLSNRVSANTYVFYLNGQEITGPNFYALAGSVEIDPSGNVLAGEQDYNDALGLTSPEPGGDVISGGTLTVDPTTGQGTLTLITNNSSVGSAGVETLGVQFVNSNHALVIQFDGTASSSGSMDLQTLPGALSGGYAFTLTGVDMFYSPVAYGGVFSTSDGVTLQNGLLDTNDDGVLTIGGALTGTFSPPDSFGRGTITSNISYSGSIVNLNYYIVGLEAIRIIDVDPSDSAIGSAFGQGANATASSNASLGNSLVGIQGSPFLVNYAAAGMLSTSNTSSSVANFSGVADDDELNYGILLAASPISGTYSVASNGYGSLTINPGDLGDISAFGIYMTDPNLNLSDPNNTASGLGGGLVANMDAILPGGTGVLIPQTDISTASFAGNYVFGAQGFNDFCCEFDFVAQGSVTGGVLSGSGLVSDPFLTLGLNTTDTGTTFAGTPVPDPSNGGRYTMFSTDPVPNPFNVTIDGTTTPLDVAVYQASGGQLFWLNEDGISVFLGSLQQQGSLTGLPAARKTTKKAKPKG